MDARAAALKVVGFVRRNVAPKGGKSLRLIFIHLDLKEVREVSDTTYIGNE
jgi:hypothetical protein